MTEVASEELRHNTPALIDRVERGETLTITVGGRPVAVLQPVNRRRYWMPRDEFVRRFISHQADPQQRNDLRGLDPDSTDDVTP